MYSGTLTFLCEPHLLAFSYALTFLCEPHLLVFTCTLMFLCEPHLQAFSRYESSRVRLEEEERILALQLTYQQKLNDENRIHG